MIHTRCIQLNPEDYHVSHLYHSKTCVNILHLSLEPPHVNNFYATGIQTIVKSGDCHGVSD
jgi:hypothetical protein